MSSRARGRQGDSQTLSQRPPDGGAMKDTTRQRVDLVREATGCTADEAEIALKENGWDVNETVVRIIESETVSRSLLLFSACGMLGCLATEVGSHVADPFTTFQSKKQKKKVVSGTFSLPRLLLLK